MGRLRLEGACGLTCPVRARGLVSSFEMGFQGLVHLPVALGRDVVRQISETDQEALETLVVDQAGALRADGFEHDDMLAAEDALYPAAPGQLALRSRRRIWTTGTSARLPSGRWTVI
ncbi:MAG: hypothetical protein AAF526_04330 [Pseudomonadota bacterium]